MDGNEENFKHLYSICTNILVKIRLMQPHYSRTKLFFLIEFDMFWIIPIIFLIIIYNCK